MGVYLLFLHSAKFKIDLAIALSGAKRHFLLSLCEQGGALSRRASCGRGQGAEPLVGARRQRPRNIFEN